MMFIRIISLLGLMLLNQISFANSCSLQVYDADKLNYVEKAKPISIMTNGMPSDFWQAEMPNPLYSDHELILAESEGTQVLSYNIMYQMSYHNRFFNNGLMGDDEKFSDYLKRLDRILARLSNASLDNDIDFMLLQETPYEKDSLNYFKKQAQFVLPEYQLYQQAGKLALFKKDLTVEPILEQLRDKLSSDERDLLKNQRLSPFWLPDKNLIVFNAHLPWLHKDNIQGNDDFHSLLHTLIEKIRSDSKLRDTDIWIIGDWNREDYSLPDRYLTLDIESVADSIAPYGKLCKSGDYTNLRMEGITIPAILTASDYLLIIPR